MPLLDKDEVARQIESANECSSTWAKTSFAQRISLMRSLKAWVMSDMDGIVRVACRDTGKTRESCHMPRGQATSKS